LEIFRPYRESLDRESYIYGVNKNNSVFMKNQNRKGMSYRKLNSSAKLAVINSRMRRGDVGRVAKSTGFSASFTSEVLSAKKSNDRIVNKAYDMMRGRMRNSAKA
jgi:hypothetical protein